MRSLFGSSFENSILDKDKLTNIIKPKTLSKELLRSEEDVKVKIINEFLKSLGYNLDEDSFHEETIKLTVGTKSYTLDLKGRSDTIISILDKKSMVIEAKKVDHALTRKDFEEMRSFVFGLFNDDDSIPRYGVLTNGIKWVIKDFKENKWLTYIPTKKQLLATYDQSLILDETNKLIAQKKFFTQANEEKLVALISEVEFLLREEGYDGERGFLEFAKVLITKINEDKRFKNGKRYRFDIKTLNEILSTTTKSSNDVINEWFDDAKNEFKGVFTKHDRINIESKNVIEKIIDMFDQFLLYDLDLDLFGIVYEKFFADLFKGEAGKYFTPREIVEFMVEFADLEMGEVICDPTCGSGGFLTRAYKNLRTKVSDWYNESKGMGKSIIENIENDCLIGNDIDPHLVILAKINMAVHGDGWNNIYRSNVFEVNNNSPLTKWHGKVDVILANPPFSIPVTNPEYLKEYELGRGKATIDSDALFLERCYKLLRQGGRMLVVLPKGWTNNPSAQWLRDWIYDNWIEIATISLPEGIFKPFGESGATTCIMYLKKPLDDKDKQRDVAKINIQYVGYDHKSKKYKKISQNDLSKVLQTDEFREFLKYLRMQRVGDRRFKELRNWIGERSCLNMICVKHLFL